MSIGVTYAEVTLFGTIDQAYTKSEWVANGVTQFSSTGFAGVQNGGSGIGFKGEEDLGNSLKASFLHELGVSTQGASGTTVRQAFVALGGAFGQVRIGKQYSQAFLNTVSVEPMGATGVYGHNSYVLLTGDAIGGDGPLRQANAVQYSLPAFVEGLGITATKTYDGGNTVGDTASDGFGVALMYSTGALHAGYTWDSTSNTGVNVTLPTYDAVSNPGGAVEIITASTSQKRELKTLSVSYDLGMAKVGFNNVQTGVGSNTLDNTTLSVGIPVGAATIGFSTSSGKLKSTALTGDAKHSGYQFGLDYNLSKRTVAYAQMGKAKLDFDGALGKNTLSSSAFGLSLIHI